MTDSEKSQIDQNIPNSESDEKFKPDIEPKHSADPYAGAESQILEELKPCLRDPTYSWLNLAIIVLAYIDIVVSFSLGLALICYYSSSEDEKSRQGQYIENQRIFQETIKDPFTKSLLDSLTLDAFQRDIERAYRRKVFYYGVGFTLMATILSPTVIISLGRSKACSYIWIFRFKAVLWTALSLNIVMSLLTIMTFSYDYYGPKRFLLLLLVPILLLRLVLWICYVLYGWKCDYKDPKNKFWPYSSDHADAKDLALWL